MFIFVEVIIGKYKDFVDFIVISINNKVICLIFYKFGNKSEDYFFKVSRVYYMIVDYENKKKVGDCILFKILKDKILEVFFNIKNLDEFFFNKKYKESKIGKKIFDEYLIYMGIILKNLFFIYNLKKFIIFGELL